MLINTYGPTESTVVATICRIFPETIQNNRIPIGSPIANVRIYLLNSSNQVVPIGTPGEIHIGGIQVAHGYVNQPEITAKQFINDPFSDDPENRLYKSGDLARWLPDGNLDYLGRTDLQIKLRGFRIEPGEIETVLTSLPAIREAAVLAREDTPGDLRLVAYLVPADPASPPDLADLRAGLRTSLPDYMVPAAFVNLDALPLTPNGKLDRKALPAPDYQAPAGTYVAPRTPTEQFLADTIADLLHLDRVGIHDNFFDLGGHSLLATQLLTRIRQHLQTDISLRMIFQSPTISTMAQALAIPDDSEKGII
jgi:acyl-CoA synthetase (AMP-forming)/AMP-acid ligase II/acyl carrier protein